MQFDLSIHINCPPQKVFAFLRDIDRHPVEPGSLLISYEKLTPGPTRVGTRYLEIVRVSPFYCMRIQNTLTAFEPPELLAMVWDSGSMYGDLTYIFSPFDGGTILRQVESLHSRGFLALFAPFIRLSLGYMLKKRLKDIKCKLEDS